MAMANFDQVHGVGNNVSDAADVCPDQILAVLHRPRMVSMDLTLLTTPLTVAR